LAVRSRQVKSWAGEEKIKNLPQSTLRARRSQVLFIWTAVPYRTGWHYGELAYKAVYWDIGHVSQNLYLAAEGVDCGVCAIGYYDEDRLDEILDIDGKTEFVIFMSAVGKKPDKIIDP